MRVKELIKILNQFDGELQVAVFNEEFSQHSPDVEVEISKKEDDIEMPYPINENLEETFVSIKG